jgi:hypothetical protein
VAASTVASTAGVVTAGDVSTALASRVGPVGAAAGDSPALQAASKKTTIKTIDFWNIMCPSLTWTRPLRFQAGTKLKLTMKIMKGMKFSNLHSSWSSCPSWLKIILPRM